MIVADASFTGSWFLPGESSTAGDRILKTVLTNQEKLAVPDLWIYEMLNLLLSAFKRKRIGEEQLLQAIDLLHSVPCISYDHRTLLAGNRILAFARRFGLSAYDASYLELADRLQCKLYSHDRKLADAASSLGLR
jgi:predicted nucleic acid-binding protein